MPIEIESPEQLGYDKVKFNLTESSYRDTRFGDLKLELKDLILSYNDHLGHPGLRTQIAGDLGLEAHQVITTVGAASALFIVATSILKSGDRMLVVRPNYATNIETPRAIGAEIDFYSLTPENNFEIDLDAFLSKITAHTKLVSLTHPHNPTGTTLPESTLDKIAKRCAMEGAVLLVDETYRDLQFGGSTRPATSFGKNVVSVSSLSKAYGLPGIRMGWLASQDPELLEVFLAAKEQIFITGSALDEEVAYQFLRERNSHWSKMQTQVLKHFDIVKKWKAQEPRLGWVEPTGGVVCFPWIKNHDTVKIENFYKILNDKYETFVGPGHWFEMPKHFMRIGFGWPKTSELEEGLRRISKTLTEIQP